MSTPEEVTLYTTFAAEIMRRAMSVDDLHEVQQWIIDHVSLLGGVHETNSLLTWGESFPYTEQLFAKWEEMGRLPEDQRREIRWPWESWNTRIGSLEPGMLAVLTAGDGMGKTIFAEMIAEHMTKIGLHCVFVHYELSWPIMMARRATRMTGLTKRDALAGLTPAQRQEIADMRTALERKGSNGYLHTPGWDVEKTIAKLSELRSQQSCDVVVLDYLEKVSSSARQAKMYSSQFQREADTVETLKNWAEAHGVPIVLLSQLSKAGKASTADNLDRTAIRGAGEKTEKANIVVMLHRDKLPAGDGSRYSNEVSIVVDKNTMGATGTWKMLMEPERFSVADADTRTVNLNEGR